MLYFVNFQLIICGLVGVVGIYKHSERNTNNKDTVFKVCLCTSLKQKNNVSHERKTSDIAICIENGFNQFRLIYLVDCMASINSFINQFLDIQNLIYIQHILFHLIYFHSS